MKNHNKAGSEVHRLILLEEHTRNNTVYSMEEAIEESAVMEKKLAEVFINRENTMAMGNIDQFKGHRGSTLHGLKVFAGRAETAVTAEGDKFEPATVRTAIHGTAKGGVPAVDHFIHVFNDGSARV